MLAACQEEEVAPKPKLDIVYIRNDSATGVRVRVKLWTKDVLEVPPGESGKIEFKAQSKTVQVDARSRERWDECWTTMQVGQTLVISPDGERIGCSVE